MNTKSIMHFNDLRVEKEPFPHFICGKVFTDKFESELLDWLTSTSEWSLTQTNFYTQFEFSVMHAELPEKLCYLNSNGAINSVQEAFKSAMTTGPLRLTEITAHKLMHGHRMGVHNDALNGEETHRFVIQINNGWKEEQGGYLMLFHSGNARDVSKIISPVSNTAFGFEISERSFHAVSTVHDFLRYAFVYTFKEE